MTRLGILGVTSIALAMLASVAVAQRRGGAVSSGVRGAAVGQMVGGSEGAAKGAKIGVVTGATRTAINRETQSAKRDERERCHLLGEFDGDTTRRDTALCRFVWLPRTSTAPALELTREQFDALVLGLPWQRLPEMGVITRV